MLSRALTVLAAALRLGQRQRTQLVHGGNASFGDKMSIGSYAVSSNWGFADGHAKNMKRNQIMDRTWMTAPATALANKARNLIHWDEAFKN